METPSVPIGTRIGVYRIESLIGSGGMGSVFRAVHSKLGRKAAIKVLADSLAADPAYVSRFFHEAKVVNEVGHPNIVDVIDFIETEKPRWVAYVMELVDGPALSTVLKTQRLTTPQVLNISLQLMDALAAVHRINVVHRDLKPDNILVIGSLEGDLSARPCIKVLDFGIAKIHSNDAVHKTTTGMMLGTPAYMSPEQVAGEPVSPATDVYAFGELLYEMLTGKRLFEGKGRAILKSKMSDQAPPFDLPPDLPDRLHYASIIRGCLSPEQNARPTIPKLAEYLAGLLGGDPAVTPVFPRPAPVPQPAAPYQPTLSGVDHTAVVGPPRSKVMILAAAALFATAVATVVTVQLLRESEPVVTSIPLEEPKPVAAPEPPPAPPPEPPPPIVELPPPAKAVKPPPKKVPPKRKPEKAAPLKKGEFPTW